jgi:hypothetical protein
MLTGYEIEFQDCTVVASSAHGPQLGTPPSADINFLAYEELSGLSGCRSEAIRVIPQIKLLPISPRIDLRANDPMLGALRKEKDPFGKIEIRSFELGIETNLSLDTGQSSFPPYPGRQVQVYTGNLVLTMSWLEGSIVPRRSPIVFPCSVTLEYVAYANAPIEGTIEGSANMPDALESIFGDFMTDVTGNFDSTSPLHEGLTSAPSPVTFEVNNLNLGFFLGGRR